MAGHQSHSFHRSPASPRVRVAAAAFCMQLALGAVYGWSVFLNPLRELFGATKPEANLTFTITLAVSASPLASAGPFNGRSPACTASIEHLVWMWHPRRIRAKYDGPLSVIRSWGRGLGLGYIVRWLCVGWFPTSGAHPGLAVTALAWRAIKVRSRPRINTARQSTSYCLGSSSRSWFWRLSSCDRRGKLRAPGGRKAQATCRPEPIHFAVLCARRIGTYCGRCLRSTSRRGGLDLVAAPLAQSSDVRLGPSRDRRMRHFSLTVSRLLWARCPIRSPVAHIMPYSIANSAFALLPFADLSRHCSFRSGIALCYGGDSNHAAFATDVFGAQKRWDDLWRDAHGLERRRNRGARF